MDGQRRTIAAPIVVLCAGAIENARILLSSNQIVNVGLGNGRDLVGRFLMDHMRGPVASFELKGSEQLQKRFGHYRVRDKEGGHVFSHGIRPTPEVQRREGLLNCALWLEGNITADDPWNAMKRLLRGNINIRNDIAAVAGNFGLLARGLNDYFLERRGLPRKIDRLSLVCMSEQQPDPDSRVTLAETCDQFGLRKARVDWRINQSEQRTFQRAARLAVEAFSRAGLPRPRLEPWVQRKEPFPEDFRDVAHPIGTTRMGDDPTTSVVSSTCEVHGISGLYVAGSSVFPTGGHANPTLTIVAMALRLADTIKLRLQQTWAPMPHARIIPETFMGSDKQATEVSSGRSAPFLPHSRSSVQGLESRGGNHP
jgi:choline dehydrogenase-like flavoprotein